MKFFLILCVVAFGSAAAELSVGEFIDQVDPDLIMDNDELRMKVFDCVMERAPCGEYESMKVMIPKTLKDKCSACTPSQKKKYDAAVTKFTSKYGDLHKSLMEKYFPETKH